MGARQSTLRRWHLDWPLLGKELLEQSARKQMYVMRVIYALVLFGAFCFYYVRHLSEGSILALGRGYGPFTFVVTTQIVTIFLFLPPLMAGAVAQEKERDTLGLLFLTDLTPWELILQKYVGRLIPMLTLLFLSLPLLAVTYSLGGVSIGMLVTSAMTLFFTCLAVGAVAMECSAHESTTFGALIRCWGICLLFTTCCWMGPLAFVLRPGAMIGAGAAVPGVFLVFHAFFNGLGYFVPTALFLVRAKQNLEARAFVHRQNLFARQFKQMDHYWKDLRKLMRALLRKRDMEAYAIAQQVVRSQLGAVEDQQHWSLAGFLFAKMQVPNLIALAIIIGFLVFIVLFFSALMDPKSMPFYIIVGGLWILALLTIPIQSVNAVASERTNERLGAILTTPLTSREILDEWMAPVRRWTSFLVRPLLFIFVVEAMVKFKTAEMGEPRLRNFFIYLAICGLTVLIYPRLVLWFCLWIGMRVRNQIRAMMTAFLLVVVWCIGLPPLFSYLVDIQLIPGWGWGGALRFLSPVTVIGTAEALGVPKSGPTMTVGLAMLVIAHFAILGALMFRFRQVCLTKADEYLGRV